MKDIRFVWTALLAVMLALPVLSCSTTAPLPATQTRLAVPQNYPAVVASPPLWIQLSPSGTAPSERKEHASVYDEVNDRLIIFGGRSSAEYFNDTWVLTNASGTAGTPSWIRLSISDATAPYRSSMLAAYNPAKDMLIVFGGGDNNNWIKMDLWVLTNANGLQITPSTWRNLTISGTPPSPRVRMAGAYDEANDTLIFFGGGSYSGSAGTLYNETWMIRNATSEPSWEKLNPEGTVPSARIDPSAVYDATNNRLIIFGGNASTANPPVPSGRVYDTWVLSNANGIGGTPAWTHLTTSNNPAARSGHSAVFDSTSKRMLIFGGAGADNFVRNDVWVLTGADETTAAWAEYDTGKPRPAPGACQSAVYTGSTKNRMIIFGGDTGNSNLVNDVWVLTNANGVPSTPVNDITIKAASTNLYGGYTLQLTAIATDASDNETSGVLYSWDSSDHNVATVSPTGLVKGVSPGTAMITVRSGNVSHQFTVTIAPLPSTETAAPPPTTVRKTPPVLVSQSVYDGTYIGKFTYEYQEYQLDQNGNLVMGDNWITAGFRLTVTLKTMVTVEGITTLQIISVNCSDSDFGTGVGSVTPLLGSVATLPADPPTTAMNPSQPGMGIAILFPNGASLATNNDASALNVTTEGRILSNSLDPGIANQTWVAVIPVGQGHLSSHPSDTPSPGQAYNWRFISWDFQKSAL